ncbi:MAG: hypothetical protein R3B97_11805 [Dehalococcoidia bacterium]
MALSIPAVMSDVTAAWLTAALTEGGALTSASIVSESKETIGVGSILVSWRDAGA